MQENNKRIFKNTVYLYLRTLVTMALGFITTRIVLEKLGASDYGIYVLVGGFVAMFKVLDSILASGTRRFLALSLGKELKENTKRTFSTAFVIHLSISLLVFIVLETLGMWFLNTQLNINPERMEAANWVFQLAVITSILGITQTPYVAAVTANEHFNMFAYMSIYDALAKLTVLYLLVTIPGDKLIVYSVLFLAVEVIGLIIYRIYCMRTFEECAWSLKVDKPLMREMLHFSGWTSLGHITVIGNAQGFNILLNLFFNTVMNAARGIANTVSFTITQFIQGFLQASTPQLVKYYGAGDMKRFVKLIFDMSQYTLFLVAIIGVPVLLELDYVLALWLNDVPAFTSAFVKIGILSSIIANSNHMIDGGITAIGRVRELNTYSIPLYLFTLPIVYLVLKFNGSPILAFLLSDIPHFLSFVVNLFILSKFTEFSASKFFINIFLKYTFLILISCIIPFGVQYFMDPGLIRFLVVCSTAVICTVTIMYFFALSANVKKIVNNKVLTMLHIKI